MGPAFTERFVTHPPDLASPSGIENHGLRFLNEDWNGSISNGQPIRLRWNQTIEGEGAGLKLFRVRYPHEGEISFELVSNLTESMDEMSCYWTPENLIDENLYALWVTDLDDEEPLWALSPPWKLSESTTGVRWSNAVGIPIIVILGVYFISLGTCLMYRRRKRIKRKTERQRKQAAASAAHPSSDADRHPSVSSAVTVQTLTEEDELVKKDDDDVVLDTTWIVTNAAPPQSPVRVVEWNRPVWRNDACAGCGAGCGAEPMIRQESYAWREGWDDGPIGQAR